MLGRVGWISGSLFLKDAFHDSSHRCVSDRHSPPPPLRIPPPAVFGLLGMKSSPPPTPLLLLFWWNGVLGGRWCSELRFCLGRTGPMGRLVRWPPPALLKWLTDFDIPLIFAIPIGFGTNGSRIRVSIIRAICPYGWRGSRDWGGLKCIRREIWLTGNDRIFIYFANKGRRRNKYWTCYCHDFRVACAWLTENRGESWGWKFSLSLRPRYEPACSMSINHYSTPQNLDGVVELVRSLLLIFRIYMIHSYTKNIWGTLYFHYIKLHGSSGLYELSLKTSRFITILT